jgi:hypothetical protein
MLHWFELFGGGIVRIEERHLTKAYQIRSGVALGAMFKAGEGIG